ncbi:hypothetical protein H6F51_18865 [Cyanobacteria bacterium FACHB-DQ100]|nr:hypothetical protein [Cyanobacteria bacterium FACHB-DQ100]
MCSRHLRSLMIFSAAIYLDALSIQKHHHNPIRGEPDLLFLKFFDDFIKRK